MKKAVVPICVILFIMFVGCYLIIMEYAREKAADRAAEMTVSENVYPEALTDDEGIQGILLEVNREDHQMDLQDIRTGKIYEIPYDGNLEVRSKHGSILSMDELSLGEVYRLFYTGICHNAAKILVAHSDGPVHQIAQCIGQV